MSLLKRIEAVVQSEIAKKIVDAIRKEGTGGVTLVQALGQGEGERPWIGGGERISN